jgi:hypothetical protein
VVVKNPDQEILKKMWSIADSLSAKVQGDEGELYGADGCSIDIAPIRTDVIYLKKPWWKLW